MNGNNTAELTLNGLDCANCAMKIEDGVRNINGIKAATVNFMAKKLSIEVDNKCELNEITLETRRLIKKLEPNVDVTVKGERKEERHGSYHIINKQDAIEFITGVTFFIIAISFHFSFWTELILYLTSYFLVGRDVLVRAGKNILSGQVFDENFLMCIATIGALAIKEFPEAVTVMLFYKLGMFFEDSAVNRSRKSIATLMDIRPDYANLKRGSKSEKVSPETVYIGDTIIVKPGEKVPLDGIVVNGASMVNTSALTGESMPRKVNPGDVILSGCINTSGMLDVKVTKEFADSTVSKILEMVENASSRKSKTENFITKFARYYTPVVVISALLLAIIPPLLLNGATFTGWINRALVFLVVSCPCALVVSIPLGFFGGIGAASRNGILVKGSNFLEALNKIDTVVFDKTGTLTKGIFEVVDVSPNGNTSKEQLLEYAAYGEAYSNHPIAQSILRAYGKELNKENIEGYEELSGYGIRVLVNGQEILVGNGSLLEINNVLFEKPKSTGTVIYIAVNAEYSGYIVIADEIKGKSHATIKALKELGVRKVVMLTGDRQVVGARVGEALGIDDVHAELLPDQKVTKFEILAEQKTTKDNIVFVGDGINDAPVLARADIGVAMGGLGSDAAIEAADVVLMEDDPAKLITAIKIAKKTKVIVWQNIILAFAIKFVILAMGAAGIATMWEAVFADVGVAVIAIFNSMRVMRIKA